MLMLRISVAKVHEKKKLHRNANWSAPKTLTRGLQVANERLYNYILLYEDNESGSTGTGWFIPFVITPKIIILGIGQNSPVNTLLSPLPNFTML